MATGWNVYVPSGNARTDNVVRRQFPAATREGNRLLVDTVFFDSDIEADDVRRSLINHDGYPGNIEVER